MWFAFDIAHLQPQIPSTITCESAIISAKAQIKDAYDILILWTVQKNATKIREMFLESRTKLRTLQTRMTALLQRPLSAFALGLN
jgi:hypothetical protein